MTNPAKYYQKQIHKKIQRLATWEPGDAVAVGDIGVIHRGAFRRQTSLDELGVVCQVDVGKTEDYRSLTSSKGVALRADAGATAPQGFVRMIASLQGAGSFIFETSGVRQLRLARVPEVIGALRSIRDDKTQMWDRRWVLVDQVWQAERGTVIVAAGRASEVGLAVRADPGAGLESLAKAEVLADARVCGADVYKLLGARNFTPLYTAWTFNLWGKVKHLSEESLAEDERPPPELDIDEFLDSWDVPEADAPA